MEEALAQLTLKRRHGVAQGGPGEAERIRSPREALVLRDGHERGEVGNGRPCDW